MESKQSGQQQAPAPRARRRYESPRVVTRPLFEKSACRCEYDPDGNLIECASPTG